MESSKEPSRQKEQLMLRPQATRGKRRFTELNEGQSGAVILSGACSTSLPLGEQKLGKTQRGEAELKKPS